MSSAQTTTNHETIRKWVERHKGHPAIVRTGREGGVLRIDFDEPGGNDDERLERISWDEFFRVFDESDVAFLHGEGESRFNKFVAKASADN
ncbi:MAG TPA: bifunctional DNA primase/polymerase [Sphingomicrobium sp.]|nr:bifunctional DNA primase/polymerase [Sphingomicrobium sp.]